MGLTLVGCSSNEPVENSIPEEKYEETVDEIVTEEDLENEADYYDVNGDYETYDNLED